MRQFNNVAIVGVTGVVGQEFLRLIEERDFKFGDLRLLASARSAGKRIPFMGKEWRVNELNDNSFDGVDLALFSAGGSVSQKYAPLAVAKGAIVIDNSSAFRMHPGVPLVVPEINPQALKGHQRLIANPNCSTIIMALSIWPLYQIFGIQRIVVATYQAASGAGAIAMHELEQQAHDFVNNVPYTQTVFGKQYLWNLFSHNSAIDPDTGYNAEETKMQHETRKIFADPNLLISATCVRVAVLRAHAMAINLTCKRVVTEAEVYAALAAAVGVRIVDDRATNQHPEPLLASGKDEVLVGRLRLDAGQVAGTGVELFVAGDQLRKGAALNAIQISELLIA